MRPGIRGTKDLAVPCRGRQHEDPSGCGHGRIRNSLIIKYQFYKSVETQLFFGHVSTPLSYNSLQINPLQLRSVAASRHPIRWRAMIWWREAYVTEKNTGKDPVEGEAPAEVEPLEAWSPMTL